MAGDGTDLQIRAEIVALEDAGWCVSSVVPASWETRIETGDHGVQLEYHFNTSYLVTYQREVD